MSRRINLHWRWSFVVLIVLLGVGNSSAAEGPGPVSRLDIVDRSIEFHGGELFQRSASQLRVCSRSGCYAVVSRIDGGLFDLQAEGTVRDEVRRVRVTNDTVELWHDGVPTEVDSEWLQTLRNWVMARVYFVYLPYRLNDGSVFKRDLGLEVWEGRSLHKVKVTFTPGSSSGADDEFLYWFDPETGRLEQFAYSYAGDPGGLRFRRAFNFRRVGGMLFYDQKNWGVEGPSLNVDDISPKVIETWRLVSTVTVEDIEVTPHKP